VDCKQAHISSFLSFSIDLVYLIARFEMIMMANETFVVTNAVAAHEELQGNNVVSETPIPEEKKKARNYSRVFFFVALAAGLTVVLVLALGLLPGRKNKDKNALETTEPTLAPISPGNCPLKKLRISHICDVPDLDDDIFGNDVTLDIKILVDDEQYWPKDLRLDCLETFGSYEGSCVIPDTSLIGCFELKNAIKMDLNSSKEDLGPAADFLKVTIYDEDVFTDDFIDILVPKSDWYFPHNCEPLELAQFAASSRSAAHVLMTITSETDEKVCAVDLETIDAGLGKTAQVFADLQAVLTNYTTYNPDDVRNRRHHRQLFLGFLFAGARA
jgi:hypothetical protein